MGNGMGDGRWEEEWGKWLDKAWDVPAVVESKKKIVFHPLPFAPNQLEMFKKHSKDIISVATDITNPKSPLWVNLLTLNNFAVLHYTHWCSNYMQKTPVGIEQRELLQGLITKIKEVDNLAQQYGHKMAEFADLRALLKSVRETSAENTKLSAYEYNSRNMLELAKVEIEFAKKRLEQDKIDEKHINDVMVFSRYMAQRLDGLLIPC